jgi:hypothetical protein
MSTQAHRPNVHVKLLETLFPCHSPVRVATTRYRNITHKHSSQHAFTSSYSVRNENIFNEAYKTVRSNFNWIRASLVEESWMNIIIRNIYRVSGVEVHKLKEMKNEFILNKTCHINICPIRNGWRLKRDWPYIFESRLIGRMQNELSLFLADISLVPRLRICVPTTWWSSITFRLTGNRFSAWYPSSSLDW